MGFTHRPTLLFHPTMELAIQAWSRITALERMTQRCKRTPGPIFTPGPMVTFGPSTAVGSISAVCTCKRRRYLTMLGKSYRVHQHVSAVDPLVLRRISQESGVLRGEV